MNTEQTLGQYRVRKSFNPSNNANVEKIKDMAAELIDLCELLKDQDPTSCLQAQNAFETAAMHAVKLATSVTVAPVEKAADTGATGEGATAPAGTDETAGTQAQA